MSSVLSGIHVHPVVDAVNAAEAAVESTQDANVWALSDDDLLAALDTVDRLAARQAELKLRLVAELDARDLGRREGGSSTAGFLRGRYRMRPADAKWAVRLANQTTATPTGPVDYAANVAKPASGREMPATRAGLAAGAISEAHAVVIAKTMHRLPDHLAPEQGAETERQLAAMAGDYDPAVLARLGACLIDALQPDTLDDDEDEAIHNRQLWINEATGRVRGQFDPEAIAQLTAMLEPLAKPASSAADGPDNRSRAQRMADALVEVARRVLTRGEWTPDNHGVRPHITLITRLNPDDHRGSAQPRLGRGELARGGPLSAAAIHRIACDAGITWIVTDPAGVPVNVGRERRAVTSAQWAALTARDGGCAFPGCDRPVEWCEAHHIIWWRNGGPTDLDNLVLLCTRHHRCIHHHGWDIQLDPHRIPEFLPPPWIDPSRTPRKNKKPRYYNTRNSSP